MNPPCSCSIKLQTATHFFLRCHFYNENQAILINDLENIDQPLPVLSEVNLVDLLLSSNENFNEKNSCAILMCAMKSFKDSQRFAGQLLSI